MVSQLNPLSLLISLKSILILPSHLRLGDPSYLFCPDHETNIFYGKYSSTVNIPIMDNTFRFPDRLWGSLSLLYNGHREILSAEVKRMRPEADHSSLCSAEVKNEWSYTSTPPYSITSCTGTTKLRTGFPALF
jgi:hypothetical protein